jgi:hypothetical protein
MGVAASGSSVGESNIAGPSGRKRAGVGSAVADKNDSAGCGETGLKATETRMVDEAVLETAVATVSSQVNRLLSLFGV